MEEMSVFGYVDVRHRCLQTFCCYQQVTPQLLQATIATKLIDA